MHESNSADASIYRLEQILSTKELHFYVYGILNKVEECDKFLTHEELFEHMCRLGHDYQEHIKAEGEEV